MRDRLITPDVMGDLMKEEIGSLKTTCFTFSSKKNKKELKEKATFNLSSSLLKDLEDMWLELRKKEKSKISKTEIVEEAIRNAIKEFSLHKRNRDCE